MAIRYSLNAFVRMQRLERGVRIASWWSAVFVWWSAVRELSHSWPTSSTTLLALLALDFIIWCKIISGWTIFLDPFELLRYLNCLLQRWLYCVLFCVICIDFVSLFAPCVFTLYIWFCYVLRGCDSKWYHNTKFFSFFHYFLHYFHFFYYSSQRFIIVSNVWNLS